MRLYSLHYWPESAISFCSFRSLWPTGWEWRRGRELYFCIYR